MGLLVVKKKNEVAVKKSLATHNIFFIFKVEHFQRLIMQWKMLCVARDFFSRQPLERAIVTATLVFS